jgi:hypothetical protein
MKHRLITALIVGLLALPGCTTTQEAMTNATSKYVGKNFDQFVLDHGIPHSKYQLNSGGYVYVWNSGIITYSMPVTTTFSGTASPYSYSGTATTTGGGAIDVFCELKIHTDESGQILSITPVTDTLGKWTTSRCAEIFK